MKKSNPPPCEIRALLFLGGEKVFQSVKMKNVEVNSHFDEAISLLRTPKADLGIPWVSGYEVHPVSAIEPGGDSDQQKPYIQAVQVKQIK